MAKNIVSKLRKQEEKFVQKIMNQTDLPAWFRGISVFQRQAADSLLNDLRDDMEQETSHRVRDVLRRLGIEPLVGPSKIKLAMKLSRGNDIAFLWFLMELYYRSSPGHIGRNYMFSTIEQLFLSTIAYLDLIPTLRELNKVLPEQIEIPKPPEQTVKTKKAKPHIEFPYFQTQPRPKMYGKKLTVSEKPYVANFNEYINYLNPNFLSLNENNRWFENFQITKNRFMTKEIISDQLDSVFSERPQQNSSLCAHHKSLKKIKENLEMEVMVTKKKACEEYFDVEKHCKTDSYKRVMKQLDAEIKRIEKNLKRRKQLHTEKLEDAKKKYQTLQEDECQEECKEEEELYNFGHGCPIDSKPKYFNAPTKNTPYKFNYPKIYHVGVAQDVVKDAIATALVSDSSGNMSIEQNRAIKNYCMKTWIKKVKEHAKKKKRAEKSLQQESELGSSSSNIPKRKQSELSVLITKHEKERLPYNPRDNNFIQMVLTSGLKKLRENKKYVLATFPHAHKYPTLREWAKRRYGMEYTKKEKLDSYVRTKRVFVILRKNALNIKIPQMDDLSNKRFVSYGCRDYILKKSNFLRGQYDSNAKQSMMNDARTFWAAFRPYHCSMGRPRKVFFAYMPPRNQNIHTFRPWKPYEHIQANLEHFRRTINKRKERF